MYGSEEGMALMQNKELQKAISFINSAGFQIDKEAFNFLEEISKKDEFDIFIEQTLKKLKKMPEKPLYINFKILKEITQEISTLEFTSLKNEAKKKNNAYSWNIESELKILNDPTRRIRSTGTLKNYLEYFQDRFKKLRFILKKRLDVKNAKTIKEVINMPSKTKGKIICMITEKRESTKGIFLQVEDLKGRAKVFVPSKDYETIKKTQRLILDQICCICVVKGSKNFLIAKDIIFPDVPLKKIRKSSIPVCVAFMSDLHIGSKMFMGKAFERFILWLQGNSGFNQKKELAKYIKYVIIAGDIVDGVGVYPEQSKELEILDLYEQYKMAAQIIEQIPKYIEVIILPGNHDASRRALPQPAILKKYAKPLYESERIHCLGDPATFCLHGVTILSSHGKSLDDIMSTIPNMSFQKPDVAMKYLLQCRHLAPTYGYKTLLASDKIDHLVIDKVPDIFHAGHVHMMKVNKYKGTLIVNSGAWQEQTDFQKEMGHIPNPGIVPIVNLKNMQVTSLNFA
jgi:DNA polymerase II small subunit